MSEWLTIIGIGEDGPEALSPASRAALEAAELVFGGARHMAMLEHPGKRAWPVPFSIAPLLAERGRKVAVLASGDPFWHGVGSLLAEALLPGEWRAYPSPSTLSLAAARLGWRIEGVAGLALHAAGPERLRAHLAPGRRLVVTLTGGDGVAAVMRYLEAEGFGESRLHLLERLGGPAERITELRADASVPAEIAPLVALAIEVQGAGRVIPRASGLEDDLFVHDGQITKRPVRALALSALAPRGNELLWDIGTGSGSVAVEWLLADPGNRAIGIERNSERAARARANAARFGLELELREGAALGLLADLPDPQAVFIGGGCDADLLTALWARLPSGTRLVAHAVTLGTEALLALWHGEKGGRLLRIELAEAEPLGRMQGWKPARPVVQWSVTR